MSVRRFIVLACFCTLFGWGGSPARAEGPFGGSVTSILLGPDGETPAWATTTAGLFRFAGSRWVALPSLGLRELSAVVETGGRLLVAEAKRGLLASDDRGETWKGATQGLRGRHGHPATDILCLVADPRRSTDLYVGTAGRGAFRSTDRGATWELLLLGLEEEPVQAQYAASLLPPRGERPLLLGTDGAGLYAFRAGRWMAAGRGLPRGLRVHRLAEDPRVSDHLALASRGQGLWESRDGGESWVLLERGAFGGVGALAIGDGGRVLAHFSAEGLGLWGEGGALRQPELASSSVFALVARRSGGWLAAVAHDGVAEVSPAGKVTGYLVRGMNAVSVLSLAQTDGNRGLWAGDRNGVFLSDDGGVNWKPRDQGLRQAGGNRFLIAGDGFYLGTLGDGVYRWQPQSGAWESRSGGLGTANSIYGFTKDGEGRLYVGTEGGVLRSDDEGLLWKKVSQGLPVAPSWLLAGGRGGSGPIWAAGGGKLFTSHDGGETWRFVLDVVPLVLASAPEDGGVWLVEANRVLRVVSDGAVLLAVPAEKGERLSEIAISGDRVWVGSDRGVSALSPEGLRRVWEGPPVRSLLPLSARELLIGTDGRAVVRVRLE